MSQEAEAGSCSGRKEQTERLEEVAEESQLDSSSSGEPKSNEQRVKEFEEKCKEDREKLHKRFIDEHRDPEFQRAARSFMQRLDIEMPESRSRSPRR